MQHRCASHATQTRQEMGSIQWSEDPHWVTPMVSYHGGERFRALDELLYHRGLLCNIEGNQLVFVDTSNSWCNLASPTAMVRINAVMDINNATVNFDKSLSAYISHILKRCDSNVGGVVPTSVCIGSTRFEIDAESQPGTIIFERSRTIIPCKRQRVPTEVYSVCCMPVATHIVPTMYTFPGLCTMLGFLAQLFPDSRDLVTALWHVGNCLLDPSDNPKSVLLCGPGGSGKSTFIRAVYSCLQSCCGTLPDGSLTSNLRQMPTAVAQVITSCRMAVCYDVDLEKEGLNMAVFKNISGSDYIRTEYVTCKSNCSLIMAANGVVNIDNQSVYKSDAIMRRVVSIYMDVAALSIPKGRIPNNPDDKLDFVCAAIHTRLRYDHIPLSPPNLVLTMCANKYDLVMEMVEETSEPLTTIDCEAVLSVLSYALGVTTKEVIFKARLVSPLTTFEMGGAIYIRGLKPT